MTGKTTKCVDCGLSVSYTTKKPKWCKKCKKKQPKFYKQPKKRIPTKSRKEFQMQYALNVILPDAIYIDNGYYSFLLSPKGAPLQLDRYYPDLKLAFEFDGKQHTEYNPYMHKSKAAFEYLQECDRLKDALCKKLGIDLIRIRHDKKITAGYLVERLDNEGLLPVLKKMTKVNDQFDY